MKPYVIVGNLNGYVVGEIVGFSDPLGQLYIQKGLVKPYVKPEPVKETTKKTKETTETEEGK